MIRTLFISLLLVLLLVLPGCVISLSGATPGGGPPSQIPGCTWENGIRVCSGPNSRPSPPRPLPQGVGRW